MVERATLTEEEVAAILGMDVEDVENERRRGRLKARKRRNKPPLYHPAAVQDYLEQWEAEIRTSNRSPAVRTGTSPGAKADGSGAVQRAQAIVDQLKRRSGNSSSKEPSDPPTRPPAEILTLTQSQRR